MAYLVHHEKRDASYIVDVAGKALTSEEAVQRIGNGIEGKDFWHTIVGLHRAECDFLQAKLGLSPNEAAKEQGRILAMDIARRTGREAPLVAVHLEREEDGGMRWHYHLVGKGSEPQNLRGETGHLQKTWDREMRDLMEGGQKIMDWQAHREWSALRREHQNIVKEQRELQEARTRARQEHREATKRVRRMASVDRWTFGVLPGLGVMAEAGWIDRNRARFDIEKAHFALRSEAAIRRHRVETEMLRKRYRARGNEGAIWQGLEQANIDLRHDQALLQAEKVAALEGVVKLRERSRRLRLASRVSLCLVPGLSMAAGVSAFLAERKVAEIERQFKGRELELIRQGQQSELRVLQAHYRALGLEGGVEHKMRAKEVERRAAAATYKVQTRGMDRAAIRRLRQANGKAISVAKRGVTRASGLALETAKDALRKIQQQARGADPHARDHSRQKLDEVIRPVTAATKQMASQLVKATVQVGLEAARTAAAAAAKLSIRTASASVKLAGGLVMALPTGGASLGSASTSATQDLVQGATEAGKELGEGSLHTARSAATASKDVLQAGLGSIASLGSDLLPPAAREAIRGLKRSGRTTLAVGKDLLTLDVIGAGGNLASGALEVGKHTAGAVARGAQGLPTVVRMPLRMAEAVPLVGSVAKVARVGMEVGATVSAGVGLGGAKSPEMEM
jgi:hypothetical protein